MSTGMIMATWPNCSSRPLIMFHTRVSLVIGEPRSMSVSVMFFQLKALVTDGLP
jgi:hypothetical protein